MMARATLRLQFHGGFRFADAAAHIDYFKRLGITDVYASPIFRARRGSTHGYDVVDPTVVSPELGGEAALRDFSQRLRSVGLGLILDIVPNHMAACDENDWWMDVLAKGEDSPFAHFFDIDWRPADSALAGKVVLPILGAPLDDVLDRGNIAREERGGLPRLRYGDRSLPLREGSAEGEIRNVLERQHYKLCWWREAGEKINWRRFFDINELVAMNVGHADVFDAIHRKPLELYADGVVDGLRIDHVDGLADPAAYCRELRRRLDEIKPKTRLPDDAPALLVVEKILGHGERLPRDWLTDGTTGYEFMNETAAVLHDASGKAELDVLWHRYSERSPRFEDEERPARLEILNNAFVGQLHDVARGLQAILPDAGTARGVPEAACRRAIEAYLAAFPVYRTYATRAGAATSDRAVVADAAERAREAIALEDRPILDALTDLLTRDRFSSDGEAALAVKLQKLSAPLAAKAVEDTAFYRYGRLLSRNDVGFDPGRLAGTVEDFHAFCRRRAEDYPRGLSATATHDHKRGEDVRARLAALSECPLEWTRAVDRWFASAEEAALGPLHPADQYMLYQTVVGAWPLDLAPADMDGLARYAGRLKLWQEKALREAKLRSSWTTPNEGYEAIAAAFVDNLLEAERGAALRADIHSFARWLAPAGALNGLVQAALRCLAPGTPDLYQGCELWDFSLVDPDNRRNPDFRLRAQILDGDPPTGKLNGWRDGGVKQAVIARALAMRRAYPDLFARGSYEPLGLSGPRAGNALAFARRFERHACVVVVPRLCFRPTVSAGYPSPPADFWHGTKAFLPDYFNGAAASCPFEEEASIELGTDWNLPGAFARFPLAFCIADL